MLLIMEPKSASKEDRLRAQTKLMSIKAKLKEFFSSCLPGTDMPVFLAKAKEVDPVNYDEFMRLKKSLEADDGPETFQELCYKCQRFAYLGQKLILKASIEIRLNSGPKRPTE